MAARKSGNPEAKRKSKNQELWQKTNYSNLIRYVPSGVYFCRIRVNGKLVRKSLKTDVLSVAKLRLADREKELRQTADRETALQRGRGQMTFGEALKIYQNKLANNVNIKTRTKEYYEQRIDALKRSWSGLENLNVKAISRKACEDWAVKFGGSSTAFNNTVHVLRLILDICMEYGVIYENPAQYIERRKVKLKKLQLPNNAHGIFLCWRKRL